MNSRLLMASLEAAPSLTLPKIRVFHGLMSLRPRTLPAGFIEPCLPTSTKRPPSGKGWLHEIKHEGCRVIARKNGDRMWLYNCPAMI